MKLGTHVTIINPNSAFYNQTGTVVEIVQGTPLPYEVEFDNVEDEPCPFAGDELKVN